MEPTVVVKVVQLRTRLQSLIWHPTCNTDTTERTRLSEEQKTRIAAENDVKINNLHLKMKDETGNAASFGEVSFSSSMSQSKRIPQAKFACLADDTDVKSAAHLLTSCWGLSRPSVLLSITGSAQEMKLEPHLELLFKRGLAEAARSTDAWVITGGTDTGVMALVGAAIAAHSATGGERMPCIGIAPYRAVMHKERFHEPGKPGGKLHARWKKMRRNSNIEAGLDPNHTHFLFIDNDKKGSAFGGEIKFRTELERQLSADMGIPKVLLVLAGGKGTVETVAESVKRKTPVVLVKEAGGASQSIAEFLEPLLRQRAALLRDPVVLERHVQARVAEFQASGRLQELHGKFAQDILDSNWLTTVARNLDLVHVFTIKLVERVPFDVAVLDAIVSAFKLSENEQREAEERKRRRTVLAPLRPKTPAHHKDARSQQNPRYPKRFEVSDERVPWSTPWDEYNPMDWTDEDVLTTGVEQGWADPPDAITIQGELMNRQTYCGRTPDALCKLAELPDAFDETGRPRNPRGRTGMRGRGLLGKWGPNHAADPIVTRFHPGTNHLQVVAIQRKDTLAWALPGGMVDAGEVVSQTVRREFTEEAGNLEIESNRVKLEELLDKIFNESNRRLIYNGYVDDPRNTDNSWMETTAYHFHCWGDEGSAFKLAAGDDAGDAVWLDVNAETEPRFANLYASHRDWVEKVAHSMKPHKNARSQQNKLYPLRAPVPGHKVSWAASWPDYQPHEFTDKSVLTKGIEQGWADPPEPDTMKDVLYEERVSFEGPITFDHCRPLNPRGRTGICGRGALGKWGPNYAADPIVTRFHPRTNHLQVVAIQRKDTLAWALPGGMVDAGEAVSLTVRREFTEEAGAVTDPAEKEVLESMLDELFAPSNGREIYRGYVDDPRNTDNAWMETTAMHFHCPRRLASALRLEAGDDAGKVTWLDVDASETRYTKLYANHKDWIDMIDKTLRQQQEHPQLLRLVVRWGRKDIAEKVLTDPDLIEQRQLPMVQGAFHEALERSNSPHFEVGLVELLLDYGARAEEVYLGGLFKSVQDDLFGYFREIRDGFYGRGRKSRHAIKRFSDSLHSTHGRRHANSLDSLGGDGEQCSGMGAHRFASAARRLTSSASAPGSPSVNTAAHSSGEVSLGGLEASSRTRPTFAMSARAAVQNEHLHSNSMPLPKSPLALVDAKSIAATLWDPNHVAFLNSLVPGFSDYAASQNFCNLIDIIFWAIACGAFELAFTLWRRCHSPLRTALLAQHMCLTIRKRKRRHVKQLEALQDRFCDATLGVLDEFEDQETARRLLQSTFGEFATLGQSGRRRISILDLAIELNNKEFISHRYCQGILDEMWLGRASRCGRVQLSRPHKPWLLFIQLMLPFLCVVQLKTNDLFPGFQVGESQQEPHATAYQSFSGLWYIPTVKRMVHLVSLTVFALITVIIALMPTCGDVGIVHYVWLGYLAAYVLQEMQQYLQGPELWWRNMYNRLDALIIVLLTVSAGLRCAMIQSTSVNVHRPAVDLIDWINQQRSVEFRPGWPWYTQEPLNQFLADEARICGWSPTLEAYRTILAVVIVIFALRMLEWFTNNSEMGVLIVIITRMINNVSDWIPILLTVTTGFAFAMCIMMPTFKVDNAELGVYPVPFLNLDISAGGPFMAPFWGIFGFYEPQDIARAQGSAFLTPLFFWFYLLIAVVLMTNLLIAMFSDTYVAVKGKSDEEFLMSRVLKVKGYLIQYVVPVPINLPFVIWDVLWTVFWRCRPCCSRAARKDAEGKALLRRIARSGNGVPFDGPDGPSGAVAGRARVSFTDDAVHPHGAIPDGIARQSTMGKFQHNRVLLRQNTRRQLATTRAALNVHVEKETFDLHVAEASETLARDRYLNLMRAHAAEKRFITSAFKRFEERMARLEGDMNDNFVDIGGKLRQVEMDLRLANSQPASPVPIHGGTNNCNTAFAGNVVEPAAALVHRPPPPVPSPLSSLFGSSQPSAPSIDTSALQKSLDASATIVRASLGNATLKVDRMEERMARLEKMDEQILEQLKQMVALSVPAQPPRPLQAWVSAGSVQPRVSADCSAATDPHPPYMTEDSPRARRVGALSGSRGIPLVLVDAADHHCTAPVMHASTPTGRASGP